MHAGDSQRHAPVVDLVIAVVLQQSVGDLRQAQSLLTVQHQADYGYSIQGGLADLVGFQVGVECWEVLFGARWRAAGVPCRR